MLPKRSISMWGVIVCLFFSFATVTMVRAADTTEQLITQVDDILKANPLRADEKVQLVTIAQDDTVSVLVARIVEGAEIKPHFHKTHDETVYFIKGTGQQMVNDKWVDVKPGSIHFNPMTKVHSTKNTGSGELVIISIFTPAMRETDRYFVK